MIRASREENDSPIESKSEGSTTHSRQFNDKVDSLSDNYQTATQELYDELQQQQKHKSQKSTDSINSDDNKSKRNPYCSRCRNHGKSAQVKGHKRHCEYRECQCEGCILVEFRQKISANQIKRRRYQKQDEECGRCVEISPPVLTKAPNTELIAKLLIGPSKSSNITISPNLRNTIPSSMLANTPSEQVVSTQISSQPPAPHLLLSPLHQQQQQMKQPLNGITSSLVDHHQPTATNLLGHHLPQFANNNHTQLHEQHNLSQLAKSTNIRSLNEPGLSNALSLFHSPGTTIGGLTATTPGVHLHSNKDYAEQSTCSSATTSGDLFSKARDQLKLVEELHHLFGPLTLYAWLKSEHFNLEKVRNMIELCRPSYQELFELRSKCASQNNDTHRSASKRAYENETSTRDCSNTTAKGVSVSLSSGNSSRRSSSNSNMEERNDEHNNNNNNNGSSNQRKDLNVGMSNNPIAATSNVPLLYTKDYASYFPGPISCSSSLNNGLSSTSSAKQSLNGASFQSPVHPLANPYDMSSHQHHSSLQASQQNDLLWPGFNFMQNGGILSNGSIGHLLHPHQLLPHFIHHHQHFLAQQAAHHHQQQQQQLSSTAVAVAAAAAANPTSTHLDCNNRLAHSQGASSSSSFESKNPQ